MCPFISFYSPTFYLFNTNTLPHYHVRALSGSSPCTHQTRGTKIDHTKAWKPLFLPNKTKMGTNRVISIAGCFIVTMPKCFSMLPLWRIDLPFHGTHTVLSCRLSTLNDETVTGVMSGLMRLDQAQSERHVWVLCIHTHTHRHIF